MDDDEGLDAVMKISFGCMAIGALGFAAIVFTVAAAIKWVIS